MAPPMHCNLTTTQLILDDMRVTQATGRLYCERRHTKGWSMVGAGAHNGAVVQHPATPPHHHGSIDATRWLLGFLQFLIAVAVIVGVVAAMSMGYPTVAIVIALVGGAFFAGQAC